MNNAQSNLNTLDHKPSTEELIQQAAAVRRPTPVRPVSQLAPAMHHTAVPIGRQMRSRGPTDITSLFQPTFTTRCYMKEASCPSKPSKYIHPNHPQYHISGGH